MIIMMGILDMMVEVGVVLRVNVMEMVMTIMINSVVVNL